jgi:integrase
MGTRYTGLYRDAHGRQKSAGTFSTKREALSEARKAEKAGYTLKRKTVYRGASPRLGHQIGRYGREWLAGHRLEPQTRASYRTYLERYILPRFGTHTIDALTREDVRVWFRELESQGRKYGVMRRIRVVGSSMYRTAVEDGVAQSNPFLGQRIVPGVPVPRQIITREEYRRLLKHIKPHYKPLIRMLAETGIRWGEALGLQPDDITPSGLMKIRRTLIEVRRASIPDPFSVTPYTKNYDVRDIQLGTDLHKLILSLPRNKSGWLFRSAQDHPIGRGYFRLMFWKPATKAAGVDGLRVHDLRHTHASWLLAGGLDLASTAKRLGHQSVSTTARYLHALGDSEERAAGLMDNLLPPDEPDEPEKP